MPKYNPELTKEVTRFWLQNILAEARAQGKQPVVIAIDSDGTLVLHTWDQSRGYVTSNLPHCNNFDVLSTLLELCEEDEFKDHVVPVIVSNQYKDACIAQENCLSQIYEGHAIDLIGREKTCKMPGDESLEPRNKGNALKEYLSQRVPPIALEEVCLCVVDDNDEAIPDEYNPATFSHMIAMTDGIISNWNPKKNIGILDKIKTENKSFGLCVDSMLLFLHKRGVEIPATIIAEMGFYDQQSLGDSLKDNLNIKVSSQEKRPRLSLGGDEDVSLHSASSDPKPIGRSLSSSLLERRRKSLPNLLTTSPTPEATTAESADYFSVLPASPRTPSAQALDGGRKHQASPTNE